MGVHLSVNLGKCSIQCRRYGRGAGGRAPPQMTACAPHFGLLKLLFLEHHETTRQQQ